jgi:hypothetical protein
MNLVTGEGKNVDFFSLKEYSSNQAQWLKPVMPATWEVEIIRIMV